MSTTKERKFAAMLLSEAEKLPDKWCEVAQTAAAVIERLCDTIDGECHPKCTHTE